MQDGFGRIRQPETALELWRPVARVGFSTIARSPPGECAGTRRQQLGLLTEWGHDFSAMDTQYISRAKGWVY